jgi:hypothetical protein
MARSTGGQKEPACVAARDWGGRFMKHMRDTFPRASLAAAALACASGAVARAQLPDTDLWLAEIRGVGASLRIEEPVNVTHRPGYDNQPAFLYHPVGFVNDRPWPRPGLLFSSADSLGATDIFRWDPKTGAIIRVTRTAESEYSPTPRNDWRGSTGFCVVRVEADSTQRLWRFDIDGSNPRVVMADVDSIGYFAWIDDDHLAAFVLGNEKKKEPHTLRVIDVGAQTETVVAHDVGRAIQLIPGTRDISFSVHEEDHTYRFFILKHGRTTGEPLIDAVGTGQDTAWLGDGTLLMSAGPAIYAATPRAMDGHGDWRLIADFSDEGITGVTRVVVAPDRSRLAFVATTSTP